MKSLLLLLFPAFLFAQANAVDYFKTNVAPYPSINGRTYTASTSDTTLPIALGDYKTHLFAVQIRDTGVILISYQLSDDLISPTHWSAPVLKDSLTSKSSTTIQWPASKSLDLTSVTLGHNYLRLIFDVSQKQYAIGTFSPKYTAIYGLKAR